MSAVASSMNKSNLLLQNNAKQIPIKPSNMRAKSVLNILDYREQDLPI